MDKLSPGRGEDSQNERGKRGKWKESKEKKLCKVLNVKTISFDVMNIGWEAEGSEDGREGRWLWINGLEGMRAEAWRGESFSEMRREMTKPWLKGFSIVNWAGGFNGSFDVWEKREEELKMPLEFGSVRRTSPLAMWKGRRKRIKPPRLAVQRLKFWAHTRSLGAAGTDCPMKPLWSWCSVWVGSSFPFSGTGESHCCQVTVTATELAREVGGRYF